MEQQLLIANCQKGDRLAQRKLYDRYAAQFFGVCRRYIYKKEDVEEVLLSAFYKIFTKINQYTGKGNFEGWMRRIVVNEALMFLRKQNNLSTLQVVHTEDALKNMAVRPKADSNIREGEILKLLDHLPTGYRTVFNLYVIEGYSHKEIAQLLKVSINTSKSQLLKARRMLQEMMETC